MVFVILFLSLCVFWVSKSYKNAVIRVIRTVKRYFVYPINQLFLELSVPNLKKNRSQGDAEFYVDWRAKIIESLPAIALTENVLVVVQSIFSL